MLEAEPSPAYLPRKPEQAADEERRAERLMLLRGAVSRERAALTVAVTAVSLAALVIVVIPVITGQMG